MHQVTVTPEPLRQPSPRCVAPRIRPMSLPWEGFSHKNSRISVHPIPMVHGVAGIEDAEHHRGQQQTSGTRRRPLSRDGRACAVMASGRRYAVRERRFAGTRGSRWTLMELSPGDSSRRMEGGEALRQPRRPPPMPGHFRRFVSFGAVDSWSACGFGSASCGFGLRTTDSMRYGKMPTLRALTCQVSRG